MSETARNKKVRQVVIGRIVFRISWILSSRAHRVRWADDWRALASLLDSTYNYMHNDCVSFEWDSSKATANLRKHGVRFSEAVGVFSDDAAITILDDDADEERFVTLGMGLKGRVLAVAYCYRGDNIRIISVRTAGRSEREQYEAPR